MSHQTPLLPLIAEPETAFAELDKPTLLIIDLRHREHYQHSHLPGAVHLDYKSLIRAAPPVMGLLPEANHLSQLFGHIGLLPHCHVLSYDDEGGGRAARLLWTLEMIGHPHYSLLNGGIPAWQTSQLPLSQTTHQRPVSPYQAQISGSASVDKQQVLGYLNAANVVLFDNRSREEFEGIKRLAQRAGHIPGAVNYDWRLAMDPARDLRLKPEHQLRADLEALGVTPEKLIIPYCQTHHRSAHDAQEPGLHTAQGLSRFVVGMGQRRQYAHHTRNSQLDQAV